MPPYELQKWEVIRVWFPDLARPHDKFCICICPINGWFFFVNSEPPVGRKAKKVAVVLENFEASFLDHTSHIDTTKIQILDFDERVDQALLDRRRNHGLLAPSVRKKIVAAVRGHGALSSAAEEIVFANEQQ